MTETVNFHPISLLCRIKQAETENDIACLMKEGAKYSYASDKTRKRWAKAAQTRKSELSDSETSKKCEGEQ